MNFEPQVQEQIDNAIWVAHSLFERNKVSGSSANLSFRIADQVYISASGGSFGTLGPDNFSVIDLQGQLLEGPKPSKEAPLHLSFYKRSADCGAVLHTHSFYSTLLSCFEPDNPDDIIPAYTPYLQMKLGTVGLVDYHKPGSKALFEAFDKRINAADGFLLAHHGPIVGAKNIMEAFNIIEELEESCKVAYFLNQNKYQGAKTIELES